MAARAELIGINSDHLRFDCPGCEAPHVVTVPPHPNAWGWNGDLDRPTLEPSVLVSGGGDNFTCHSFIRQGRIEFLSDCSHGLAGQTVELPLVF